MKWATNSKGNAFKQVGHQFKGECFAGHQFKGECFYASGPPIETGMLLSKATDSLFSGRGAGGLQTNVVPQKNAIVVVQWGL